MADAGHPLAGTTGGAELSLALLYAWIVWMLTN